MNCSAEPGAIVAYRPLERAKGIEPSSVAWEATALPLSYARVTRFYRRPDTKSRSIRSAAMSVFSLRQAAATLGSLYRSSVIIMAQIILVLLLASATAA